MLIVWLSNAAGAEQIQHHYYYIAPAATDMLL